MPKPPKEKKTPPSNSMLSPSQFAPSRLPVACDRPNVCITMPLCAISNFQNNGFLRPVRDSSFFPPSPVECFLVVSLPFHPQITWHNAPSPHFGPYLRLEFFPGPGTSHTSKSSVPLPKQPYTFTLPLLTPTTTEVPA